MAHSTRLARGRRYAPRPKALGFRRSTANWVTSLWTQVLVEKRIVKQETTTLPQVKYLTRLHLRPGNEQ